MSPQVFCSSKRASSRRLRSLSVSLAALLTVLIGAAGCSGDAPDASSTDPATASPPATATTGPATASSASPTASPLYLGPAEIEGKKVELQLYSLPAKVDTAVLKEIGAILEKDDDESL